MGKKLEPKIEGQSILQAIIDEARDVIPYHQRPEHPRPGDIFRDFQALTASVWNGSVWLTFPDNGTEEMESRIRDASTKAVIMAPRDELSRWDEWEAQRTKAVAEREIRERELLMSRHVPDPNTTVSSGTIVYNPTQGNVYVEPSGQYQSMAAWEKVVETWNDFGGAEGDYDDMCEALYSVMEEIMNPDDPPPSVT